MDRIGEKDVNLRASQELDRIDRFLSLNPVLWDKIPRKRMLPLPKRWNMGQRSGFYGVRIRRWSELVSE
jgi:hypothetical protein